MNPSKLLNDIFNKHWDKYALISDNNKYTYQDLYSYSNSVKDWAAKNGCKAGDIIAIQLPNSEQFLIVYLACLIGGFKFAPINTDLPESDQRYIIDRLGVKLVLNNHELLSDIKLKKVREPEFNYPQNQIAGIFFTSGTTGKPKGVTHTLESLLGNVVAFNKHAKLRTTSKHYHCLPMAYMAGFLNAFLSPCALGATIFMGQRFSALSALNFWSKIIFYKINVVWITPTIAATLIRINRDENISRKLSKNIQIYCGTAPLNQHVKKLFYKIFGLHLIESYGMSEVLLVSAQARNGLHDQNNTGQIISGIEILLKKHSNNKNKELLIKSPYQLNSYIDEFREFNPVSKDGYFSTGDLACIENDSLVINGRIKDLIIRGGINIYPRFVENILGSLNSIKEIVVMGIPDEYWGEIIIAIIVLNIRNEFSEAKKNIIDFSTENIHSSMRPDKYFWVDRIPKTISGKVNKKLLLASIL